MTKCSKQCSEAQYRANVVNYEPHRVQTGEGSVEQEHVYSLSVIIILGVWSCNLLHLRRLQLKG